jgi:carbon-monoxide dehydrogenase large subunit
MKFGVGEPATRVEDRRLLRGMGQYSDDLNQAGQVRAYFVRSPFPAARIVNIDATIANSAPGVIAVFTGKDIEDSGLGHLPCLIAKIRPQKRHDGQPMFVPPRPAIAHPFAAFVGDIVAMVIAQTHEQARDAAELVDVQYEERPANVDPLSARDANTAPVWDECKDNVCFLFEMGNREAVDQAMANAHHVTELRIPVSRVAMNPMEPRAVVASYDLREERYTLRTGTQMPHDLRHLLAEDIFGISESRIRVISPDMGGAFGLRSTTFPELVTAMWASKKIGRPVKWTCDRSEGFLADDHARDQTYDVKLALDAEGNFTGMRVESVAALGAYLSVFGPVPAFGNIGGVAGVYRTPAIDVKVWGVFTNTTPVSPYRGAGRPEATMAIELAIDKAARELGIDRIELRRRNLIPAQAMPFQTPLSYHYDSGEFEKSMDMVCELADVKGFTQRLEASRAAGKLRGIGIVNAIEQSAGMFDEAAEIAFDGQGFATVKMGTHSHGQGHETVFRQLLADRLGLDFERVRYVQGDTDAVPYGHGTGGSRASGLGGAALAMASDRVIDSGRKLAAASLEAAEGDVDFSDGEFRVVGTDRTMSLDAVARIANSPIERPPGFEAGLRAFASFTPTGPTFPNGCHVSEVEIDPETGVTTLARYAVVTDVGTVLNPMLLRGQVHGGIVQGAGQILMESVTWDTDSGQLLTGSFMDYCMPRADDFPMFKVQTHAVHTPTNPLGIKGAGESGTVGAMPCVMSAVLDALAHAGVNDFAMPASPGRVWHALRDAPA